jgi:hypothetical protein
MSILSIDELLYYLVDCNLDNCVNNETILDKNDKSDDIYDMVKNTDILTPLNLFVCTLSANIKNFKYDINYITNKFEEDFIKKDHEDYVSNSTELDFDIIAVNTNYKHFCRHGCDFDIKSRKKIKKNKPKKRQSQGDETVFHSAMQLTIILDMPIANYLKLSEFNKANIKKYYIKLYPSTGKIQIPGIIKQDLIDGKKIITGILKYINGLTIDSAIVPDSVIVLREEFCIEKTDIIMINYNTSLYIISNRILFNLNSMGRYISLLEDLCIYEDMTELWSIPKHKKCLFSEWNELVIPPFLILKTKLKNNDKFISFLFIELAENFVLKNCKIATIKIFQKGKINILGVKNQEYANKIYLFLKKMIYENIHNFIAIKPIPDV